MQRKNEPGLISLTLKPFAFELLKSMAIGMAHGMVQGIQEMYLELDGLGLSARIVGVGVPDGSVLLVVKQSKEDKKAIVQICWVQWVTKDDEWYKFFVAKLEWALKDMGWTLEAQEPYYEIHG